MKLDWMIRELLMLALTLAVVVGVALIVEAVQ